MRYYRFIRDRIRKQKQDPKKLDSSEHFVISVLIIVAIYLAIVILLVFRQVWIGESQ